MSIEQFKEIMIFTDGACTGNPGPGGWGAIVVYPEGHVTELGGGEKETTNNRMELMAAIKALAHVREREGAVSVYTDSVYVIRGITQWVHGWAKRGWVNAEGAPVANQDLWKKLSIIVRDRKGHKVSWHYVRGHAGIPGNERVDEIAVGYTKNRRSDLYDGPLLRYTVAVHDLPASTELPEPKPKSEQGAKKAHSYLSLIGGQIMRHATWADCERHVKGRSGAKFKKAMSPADEVAIVTAWGYSARDLP